MYENYGRVQTAARSQISNGGLNYEKNYRGSSLPDDNHYHDPPEYSRKGYDKEQRNQHRDQSLHAMTPLEIAQLRIGEESHLTEEERATYGRMVSQLIGGVS